MVWICFFVIEAMVGRVELRTVLHELPGQVTRPPPIGRSRLVIHWVEIKTLFPAASAVSTTNRK